MKKILSIIALLSFVVIDIFAKEFTTEQKALRLEVVKYLKGEGYDAQIDADGDVRFDQDAATYYVVISSTHTDPLLITLYQEYTYDDEGKGLYTRKNVESCIPIVVMSKAFKLYCKDSSYTYRADLFCKNISLFKSSFHRLMQELVRAHNDVHTVLSTGLGGMDVMGNKDDVFIKASSYYMVDDFEKSYPIFKMLANVGYAKAYGYMGQAYEFGEGVAKDEDLMVYYFKKAIEGGYNWCAYHLGAYYYNNNDYTQALSYYEKCGANENVFRSNALYQIGKMWEDGVGMQKNRDKAVLFYKKSVVYSTKLECEARVALINLGETIEYEVNFKQATKSMLMGMSSKGMYEMGLEYEQGLNNRYVSLPKAYAYFKASADREYTKAFVKMGEIYRSKYYPFNDFAKSDKYYQKAYKIFKQKEDTDGEACYELGCIYQNGYGVSSDAEQARYFFKSGALKGNPQAAYQFGVICKGEMEYSDAFRYFQQAADKGLYGAMFELAELYEKGYGVTFNRSKAIEWYTQCLKGDSDIREKARKALKALGMEEEKE